MPLPSPLNWLGIPGPQKPLYYWHWRNTYGTSWTEEGAFDSWKIAISRTLVDEGHITNSLNPIVLSADISEGDRIDPNIRRWIDFMLDKNHLPHDGPFVLQDATRIEFSREYLPPLIDDSDDTAVARYKYSEIDSKTPFDSEYFESMWGEAQTWQDNWELVDWVIVDASPDVYWGYILKIN